MKQILTTSERFVKTNSPHILTGIGCLGLVSTAVLASQATIRAIELVEDDQQREWVLCEDRKDYVKHVAKFYIPAIATGSLSIAAIVGSNRIGTRRAAALATAYTISDKAFHDYKQKVIEHMGEKHERGLREEIQQDRLIESGPTIVVGSGNVICFDSISGRQFESSVEKIRSAVNDINEQIFHSMYASLADFYSLIGLPTTSYSQEVGWNIDQKLEIEIGSILHDKTPCISIEYRHWPTPNYMKF